MSAISFSIVIPTFRRLDALQDCLDGIRKLNEKPVQIVIVYRPAEDVETAKWIVDRAAGHPDWLLVPIGVPGQVAALNAGVDVAKGEVVVVLDDDAVPRPDWISKVLSHFEDPLVGAAGGRDVLHIGGECILKPELSKVGHRDFWGNIIGQHHLVVGPARDVEVVKGCNWAIRRGAIGTLRFDERLPGHGAQPSNDYWYCLNLRRMGWKIILDPTAIVDHYPGWKPDYQADRWSYLKCRDWTASNCASRLAFASWHLKARYVFYSVIIGHRHCPGLFFLLHSLLRRPRSLFDQLAGGWTGFFLGWNLSKEFGLRPPGRAHGPPGHDFRLSRNLERLQDGGQTC
ncbi:glycosyltransferase [Bradyrhizobium sp. CSA207]|nr:glycosyltransferase [Bradyrhizobium sp. CSA207]